MKATDLMLGDWVKLMNPKGECIDYVKIDANLFGIFLRDGEEGFVRFEPIPLTPEILKKNGFDSETFLTAEWEKEVYFKEFPGCVVEPDDSGKYTFGTTCYWHENDADGSPVDWGTMYESKIKGLHYVHELQRALRCCGLDDLANNFQID